jgi:mono/diheme cytochrome c family protein
MSNPQEMPNASSRLDRGEQHDVTELHAAVLREKPDPVEGFEPVNLWVVAGIAGLLFWGGSYLTQYSGRFEAMEFSEFPHGKPVPVAAVAADPLAAVKREGMIAYNAVCALCHGEDGAGKAGVAPTLAGSDWVNADGPNRLLRIVRHGLKGTVKVNKDVTWNPANDPSIVMGSQWDAIGGTNEKLAAVLTYIRSSWGNTGAAVTPHMVADGLAPVKDRSADANWTQEELLQVPVSGAGAPAAAAVITPDQLKAQLQALPDDQRQALLKELSK